MGLSHTRDKADGEKGEMKEEIHSRIQTALKAVVPSKPEQYWWEILPISDTKQNSCI